MHLQIHEIMEPFEDTAYNMALLDVLSEFFYIQRKV
jgi:hypothetical protein